MPNGWINCVCSQGINNKIRAKNSFQSTRIQSRSKKMKYFQRFTDTFFSTKFGLKCGYGGYSNWSIIFFLFRPDRIYFVYYGLVAINSQFFLSLPLSYTQQLIRNVVSLFLVILQTFDIYFVRLELLFIYFGDF